MKRDKGSSRTIYSYFDVIPENIFIVDSLPKGIKTVDMRWSHSFDTDLLKNKELHITQCCHIISLFSKYKNITGPKYKLPLLVQENYHNHEYIVKLRECFKDFKFCKNILNIANNMSICDVSLQLRITDGGFKKFKSCETFQTVETIINQHNKIYFSTDDFKSHETYKHHKNVIVYDNINKFENNDDGSYYSLVDFINLSRSKIIYAPDCSSFSLMAFIISDQAQLKYYCEYKNAH